MTVIAGFVDVKRGVCAIAADSRVCWGEEYQDGIQKLYGLGAALLGHSGALLYHGYLRNAPPLVEPAGGLTVRGVEDWLQALVDGQRAWANQRGHGSTEGSARVLESYALVVSRIGTWSLSSDGSYVRLPSDRGTTGSGARYAEGAMWAIKGDRPEPAAVVRTACEAAVALSRGCGGDIQVMSLGKAG